MTWTEMMEILDWMTPRWTEVARWSEERIYAFFEDLQSWRATDVQRSIRDIYEAGPSKAPTGGLVIKHLRAFGYSPELDDVEHEHVWGIMEYETDREDGQRLAVCATCAVEGKFTPSRLLTVSEITDRAASRSVAP